MKIIRCLINYWVFYLEFELLFENNYEEKSLSMTPTRSATSSKVLATAGIDVTQSPPDLG